MKNFHSSWRDGLAFCAILDRHRPDILNYDDCDPNQPMENLERAFKVAEEELGIIRIVDPEGTLGVCLFVYVFLFVHSPKRWSE